MRALRWLSGFAVLAFFACGSDEFTSKDERNTGGQGGIAAGAGGASVMDAGSDVSAGGLMTGAGGGTISEGGDGSVQVEAGVSLPAPIAHWEFSGNLLDSSGNGFHGEEHGSITYAVSGEMAGAVLADGYVRVDSFAETFRSKLDSLSIVLRLFVTAYDRQAPLVGLSGDSDMVLTNKWILELCPETFCSGVSSPGVVLETEAGDAGDNSYALLGPLPTAGEWFQITVVVVDSKVDYYVNGELVSTSFYTPAQTLASQFYLGGTSSTTQSLNGILDDVRVYDVALTEDQVAAHADLVGAP